MAVALRIKQRRRIPGVRALAQNVNGHQLKCPSDPPTISEVPWNTLVTSCVRSSDGLYTIGDWYKDFCAQVGIKAGTDVAVRFLEIRAWEIGGNSLTVGAMDLLDQDDYIAVYEDQPARNAWAKVGYRWPKAHQMRVYHVKAVDNRTAAVFYCATQSGATTKVKAHLRVLWKPNVISLPGIALTELREFRLRETANQLVDVQYDHLRDANGSQQDSGSSTVESSLNRLGRPSDG